MRLATASKFGGALLLILITASQSQAAGYQHIRQKMNYQGMLTNTSGTPYTGTRSLTFRLYDQSSGGSALWTETQSTVAVANGIFNVVLGSVNSINVPFRKEYWLEIQVEAETMTPRHLLSNASYAMASRKVVYQQVITVAHDGGDTCTVYSALQMIAAESPTPAASDQWVIEVQAGTFTESNDLTLPDGVSLRGQGWNTTTLNLAGLALTIGSSCGVESLTLNMSGSAGKISMASTVNSHIRECNIITNQATPYVLNMQGTVNCDFSDNQVLAQTSGLYILYIQTAQDARVTNNFIDLTQITGGTGIFANNITRTMVLNNIIRFEGTTDSSWGIQINNNTSNSRVSYNVFHGEATTPNARDIYNTTTAAYPVRPTHTGPYGICNHGSDGSELPAF
ncbi:MAG: hypothetical protein AB1439_03955 [candidate division FCPU426 bacterium]